MTDTTDKAREIVELAGQIVTGEYEADRLRAYDSLRHRASQHGPEIAQKFLEQAEQLESARRERDETIALVGHCARDYTESAELLARDEWAAKELSGVIAEMRETGAWLKRYVAEPASTVAALHIEVATEKARADTAEALVARMAGALEQLCVAANGYAMRCRDDHPDYAKALATSLALSREFLSAPEVQALTKKETGK